MSIEQTPGNKKDIESGSFPGGEAVDHKFEMTEDVALEMKSILKEAIESATDSVKKKEDNPDQERVSENDKRNYLKREIEKSIKVLGEIEGGIQTKDEAKRVDESLGELMKKKKRLEEIETNNDQYSARLKEFKEKNVDKIEGIRESFYRDVNQEAVKKDREQALKNIKDVLLNLSVLIKEAADIMHPHSLDYPFAQDIFGYFLKESDILETKKRLFEMKDGLYRPSQKNDGGDGWFKNEGEEGEVGVLFDTEGHGDNTSNKKIFMMKIFEALEPISDDKRWNAVVDVNSALEKITDTGAKTVSSYYRVRVKLTEGKREVFGDFYGDSIFVVFDPDIGKFFHRGLPSGISGDLFSDIPQKNESGENIGTVSIGYQTSIIEDIIGKTSLYHGSFSKNAEVILASDGIIDHRMKYKDGKNLVQMLESFVELRKNGSGLSLVEYLKISVSEAENIVDDITVMEVGKAQK